MDCLILVFLFLTFACVPSFCTDEVNHMPPPWTPIDWTTIPLAKPTDQVTVLYLLAPLLEEDFGNWLGDLNLYHGALGFFNQNSNYSITLNYDAYDFFRNSLFPKIAVYSNGTRDLVWDNGGASFIYMGINETYWEEQYKVASVNGTVFNAYLSEFNSQINGTYPYYNMFSTLYQYGANPWLSSWDCFDFVWSSFDFLHKYGGVFDYSLHLKRNFANIYSSVAPADYTTLYNEDPVARENIIDFYAYTQLLVKDLSIMEFITATVEVFEGIFYVRQSTEYWQATLHFPYIGLDFDEAPLPGQPSFDKETSPIMKMKIIA